MPITWRNVSGPSDAAAVALLKNAGTQFNQGSSALEKMAQGQTALQEKKFDAKVDYNTANFLDQLAGYRDPAALEQALKSGQVKQQLAGYGGMIDRNAVRGKADSRLEALYGQQDQAFAREDATRRRQDEETIRNDRQDRDDYFTAIRNGDKEAAAAAALRIEGNDKQDVLNRGTTLDNELTTSRRNEATYQKTQSAKNLATEAMKGDGLLADKLAKMREMAQAKGFDLDSLGQANQMLREQYANIYGITPEQQQQLLFEQEALAGIAQEQIAQAETGKQEYQTMLENAPAFAKIDQPKLSVGELNTQVLKDFDLDTGEWFSGDKNEATKDTYTEFIREGAGKAETLLSKMGNDVQPLVDPVKVVLEAIRREGTHDNNEDGGELDFSKIADLIPQVLEEAVKSAREQRVLKDSLRGVDSNIRQMNQEILKGKRDIELRYQGNGRNSQTIRNAANSSR